MIDEQTKDLIEENLSEEIRALYELFYIFKPFEEVEGVHLENKISDIITNYGGKIVDISKINRLKMAYPIKSFDIVNSQYIRFYLEPSKVEAINKDLKFLNDILRYILTKINEKMSEIQIKKQERAVKKVSAFKEEKQKKLISKKIERKTPEVATSEEHKESDIDLDKKLDEILENEFLE